MFLVIGVIKFFRIISLLSDLSCDDHHAELAQRRCYLVPRIRNLDTLSNFRIVSLHPCSSFRKTKYCPLLAAVPHQVPGQGGQWSPARPGARHRHNQINGPYSHSD